MMKEKQIKDTQPQHAWYRRAAGVTLALGASAVAQPANAEIVFTDVSDQDITTTGTTGQQTLYFRLFTEWGEQGQALQGGYSSNSFGSGAEPTPDWTQFIRVRFDNWGAFLGDGLNNAMGDLTVEVYPNPFNLTAGALVVPMGPSWPGLGHRQHSDARWFFARLQPIHRF